MKRVATRVLFIVFCITATAGAGILGHRHSRWPDQQPSNMTSKAKLAPNGPQLPPPSDIIPVPDPMLQEMDPNVPTVWGIIESTSHDGWYGVHVKSVMCAPFNYMHKLNEDHVVAKGEKGLKVATGVFLTHDHKTGRYSIKMLANEVLISDPFTRLAPVQGPKPEDAEPLFDKEELPAPSPNKET